jgi:hypothetical protein
MAYKRFEIAFLGWGGWKVLRLDRSSEHIGLQYRTHVNNFVGYVSCSSAISALASALIEVATGPISVMWPNFLPRRIPLP